MSSLTGLQNFGWINSHVTKKHHLFGKVCPVSRRMCLQDVGSVLNWPMVIIFVPQDLFFFSPLPNGRNLWLLNGVGGPKYFLNGGPSSEYTTFFVPLQPLGEQNPPVFPISKARAPGLKPPLIASTGPFCDCSPKMYEQLFFQQNQTLNDSVGDISHPGWGKQIIMFV